MDFVAIDFETAAGDRSSACAVGLAIVKAGRIEETFSSFIRPRDLDFNPRNIALHGITPEMVVDAPTFAELWPQLEKQIGNSPLVAHNASFDMSVIRASADAYDMGWPSLQCACTMKMAQQLLPGLKNYKLITLTNLFGIAVDHHDPASDAQACAEVALRLGRMSGKGILCYVDDVPRETAYVPGSEAFAVSVSLSIDELREAHQEDRRVDVDIVGAAPADGRFEGCRFVFTGTMELLSRSEAKDMVKAQGAEVSSSISRKVDYLVVGNGVKEAYRKTRRTTGKLARAVELQAEGCEIHIVDETEFLNILR